MKIYFTKWLWKLFLLATLLTFSGCIPEKRSCVDIIIPPGCKLMYRINDLRCCHIRRIYVCDVYIYRDSRGWTIYRIPADGIPACVGPLGRCRELGPYPCM